MSIGRMMPVEFRAPSTSAKTTTCTRLIPGNPALEMPMPNAAATASVHCAALRDGIGSPVRLHEGERVMRKMILGVAAVMSLMLAAATPSAQQVAPGDWPHFNRDAGSSRYVPLDQINATNVTRLQPAWNFSAVTEPPPGAGPGPAGRAGAAGRGGRGAGGGVGAQVVPVVV